MGTYLRRIPHELTCFLFVAGVWATYLLIAADDRFYHDAASYWRLGDLFEHEGRFSLLSYDEAYRGYALPLWNHGLGALAAEVGIGDSTIVQLTGSLLVATLGVVVVPRLARALFSDADVGWARVLAFNALLFVFWRDHLGFPSPTFRRCLRGGLACSGCSVGRMRDTRSQESDSAWQ